MNGYAIIHLPFNVHTKISDLFYSFFVFGLAVIKTLKCHGKQQHINVPIFLFIMQPL